MTRRSGAHPDTARQLMMTPGHNQSNFGNRPPGTGLPTTPTVPIGLHSCVNRQTIQSTEFVGGLSFVLQLGGNRQYNDWVLPKLNVHIPQPAKCVFLIDNITLRHTPHQCTGFRLVMLHSIAATGYAHSGTPHKCSRTCWNPSSSTQGSIQVILLAIR